MKRSIHRSFAAIFMLSVSAALCAPVGAQNNGGFESGLTNWTAVPTTSVTVDSSSSNGFPSEGSQYARVVGTGGPGIAGYGPHLAGSGTGSVTVLSRLFTRPTGVNCEVQLDWNFFQNEFELNPTFNDFLSIDIIDVATNTRVTNMVFIDNGLLAGTPFYTGIPGAGTGELSYVFSQDGLGTGFLEPLPHGFKRARADIAVLTTAGQALRIDIAVGNTGDAATDSLAFVDNFKVLSGGSNSPGGSLRILGASHQDGIGDSSDSGGDSAMAGPIDFEVRPGQRISVRNWHDNGGVAFAMLSGTVRNDGSDFGFDEFNLNVSAGIATIFDGLNPSTPIDVLLGTTNDEPSFLEATIPESVLPGEFGLYSIFADPTSTSGLQGSATTRIIIRTDDGIPLGTTEVLNAFGSPLTDDDTGVVDLSSMIGGGFNFYGTLYTECHLNSNGNITFGTGSSDFSSSIAEFFANEPRIAPLWEDFGAPFIGTGTYQFDVTPTVATLSWTDLRDFVGVVEGNSFSVQLFSDGSIVFAYDSTTVSDGVVGITPGGLPVPAFLSSSLDFSDSFIQGGGFNTFAAATPIVQAFRKPSNSNGDFDAQDIMTLGVNGPSRITFVPEAGGGYRVFVGTR
ncbi:MAG: hypothetical protein V3W41_12385 [Planctomycetota bacterium]